MEDKTSAPLPRHWLIALTHDSLWLNFINLTLALANVTMHLNKNKHFCVDAIVSNSASFSLFLTI